MSRCLALLLYWSPRVLGVAFALFLSLFALDAFHDVQGFWPVLGALLLHLIPAAAIAAVLVIAWRHEWIGAILFALAAAFYAWSVLPQHLDWALTIALPLLAVAALFLINWIERGTLRASQPALR